MSTIAIIITIIISIVVAAFLVDGDDF